MCQLTTNLYASARVCRVAIHDLKFSRLYEARGYLWHEELPRGEEANKISISWQSGKRFSDQARYGFLSDGESFFNNIIPPFFLEVC